MVLRPPYTFCIIEINFPSRMTLVRVTIHLVPVLGQVSAEGKANSRLTWSDSILISFRMDSMGRLLSRPRVNGTMQKLHMFSQPLMMELCGGRVAARCRQSTASPPVKKYTNKEHILYTLQKYVVIWIT